MAYQVSVFLENKAGCFRKVTAILKDANVNIQAMTLSTTTMGWGILNLIVSDPHKAEKTLKEANYPVALRRVIALSMNDTAGGLDNALAVLEEVGVNMETAYGRNSNSRGVAVLIVDVQDIQDVEEKIASLGVELLSDEEVYCF